MRTYGDTEQGRFLLRALLWGVLLLNLLSRGLDAVPLNQRTALMLGGSLLPLAVVFWAVHRGSFSALVILSFGSIQEMGWLAGLLRSGGGEVLTRPAGTLAVFALLLRVLVIGFSRSSSAISGYLAVRGERRRRWDLPLEAVLFLTALALSALLPRFLL